MSPQLNGMRQARVKEDTERTLNYDSATPARSLVSTAPLGSRNNDFNKKDEV